MADEDDRPRLLELAQEAHALLSEEHVADRQRLVDHQDVGIDMGDDRECKADVHATRIGLYRLLDEVTDVGERDDRFEALVDLGARKPQHHAAHVDVLAPRELGIEARTKLKQRGDAPLYLDISLRWRQRTADYLQQRRFSGTIAPDDTERLAPPYVEGNAA